MVFQDSTSAEAIHLTIAPGSDLPLPPRWAVAPHLATADPPATAGADGVEAQKAELLCSGTATAAVGSWWRDVGMMVFLMVLQGIVMVNNGGWPTCELRCELWGWDVSWDVASIINTWCLKSSWLVVRVPIDSWPEPACWSSLWWSWKPYLWVAVNSNGLSIVIQNHSNLWA